ncbi:GspH/FimT family pseudopilin [Marinobacter sp. 1Y8]
MITRSTHFGLTLIELVATIAVLTVLISIAMNAWRPFIETVEAATVQSSVARAFTEARLTAVQKRSLTTLCPLDEDDKCSNNWNHSVVIFTDPLNQKAVTSNDQIEYVYTLSGSGKLISSLSGLNHRRYFQYKPDGGVNGTIGNLTWCPDSGNETRASQVRINFGGRLLWAEDEDHDGIAEDSGGQPLNCS